MCSSDGTYRYVPALVLELVGDWLPSMIVIVSYILVYMTLSKAIEDVEVRSLKQAVLILTVCYLVFIIPHAVVKLFTDSIVMGGVMGVLIHCWYWSLYAVNFFIYIAFWRRLRTGICIFLKDIRDILWRRYSKSSDQNIQDTDTNTFVKELSNLQ